MLLKKVFFIISILLLLNNLAYAQTSNNTEVVNHNNIMTLANANDYDNDALDDLLLSNLKLEKEFLLQKQKTYDTFLTHIEIFLAGFAILLFIMFGLAGFFGYTFIKDLLKRLKQDLDNSLEEKMKTQKELMKNTYEKPLNDAIFEINKLKDYIKSLKNCLKRDGKNVPEFYDENTVVEEETKNIFDEK